MFDSIGLIVIDKTEATEEQLMEVALEAGADDIKEEGDQYEVYSSVDDFDTVHKAIKDASIRILNAELTRLPQTTVKLEEKHAITMLKLYSILDDHEDVQNVYANFDIEDEILENFAG
jgi:transcriptional/translational regulatory protein YebC/TACO1